MDPNADKYRMNLRMGRERKMVEENDWEGKKRGKGKEEEEEERRRESKEEERREEERKRKEEESIV